MIPNEVEYGGRAWDSAANAYIDLSYGGYAVVDVADDNYGQGLIVRVKLATGATSRHAPKWRRADVVIDADDFEQSGGKVLSYV